MFATDGVTDNVVPQDIETYLQDYVAPDLTPNEQIGRLQRFVEERKVSAMPTFLVLLLKNYPD